MAYADGELDAQTCREIEAALPVDADLAQRVAHQRALQSSLRATFAPVLEDAVPQRLLGAARGASVEGRLATAATEPGTQQQGSLRTLWAWQLPAVFVVITLLIGIFVGRLLSSRPGEVVTLHEGRMLATSALDTALSRQAGGAEPVQSSVVVGLSYRTKGGGYCRTFTMKQSDSIAGLACREAEGWHVQVLAQTGPKSPLAQYRMAGTLVPPLILGAVERTIDGSPLDAHAEAAARARDWQD